MSSRNWAGTTKIVICGSNHDKEYTGGETEPCHVQFTSVRTTADR